VAAFSRDALRFLSELQANNNRDWFLPRKSEYERLLRQPMFELVEAVNADLAKHAPDYVTDPTKAVYRIYRDTRFSKDKTPYKTHIAALFWHKRLGKGGGAALYFHVSPKDAFIAAGLYQAPPEIMLPVRQHIASDHDRLRKIVRSRSVEGESLTRAPKGFSPDHPAIDLLKQKNLLLEKTLEPRVPTTPEFARQVMRQFRSMAPFVEFLNEPLVSRRRAPQDPLLAAATQNESKGQGSRPRSPK
jgi:uncharacterized protein (TIGR02453 family)